MDEDQQVKPKRGRKPKSSTVGTPILEKQQKKTKQTKQNVYNTFTIDTPIDTQEKDDEHIILKLNISSVSNTTVIEPYDNTVEPFASYNKSQENLDEVAESEPSIEETDSSLKVVDLLKDFEEKNKNNEWPQTTSIHCYWCCHKFANSPFGLPIKFSNGKFYVIGCFCSTECACAYNFDTKDSPDEIWERNNLLNLLSSKLTSKRCVKPSPPRTALQIFGGHLTIEEFRDYCISSKIINVNYPPMQTLRQQLEEINECEINENKYVPIDNTRVQNYKDKLVLKRSKPINTFERTLDHSMNLKFGAKTTLKE